MRGGAPRAHCTLPLAGRPQRPSLRYLWWHHRYEIDGRTIETVEARGNGGQYVFVVPTLELVVVITAGNYRGGLRMTRQPEEILRRYVLPSALPTEG